MPDILPTKLILNQSSSGTFAIWLRDNNGNPESLFGADRASLAIKDYVGSATNILFRSTAAANLSINITDSKLVGTITGAEADALVPGSYVGQAAVRFGSDNNWRFLDYIIVEVAQAVASKV